MNNASPTLEINPHDCTRRKTNPGIISEPHVDPAWSEIAAALGELDTGEDSAARERIATVLQSVLAFLTSPADARQGDTLNLYGRRVVALRLALDPDAFGKSVSLREVASRLGMDKSNLCRLGQQAVAAFGLKPTATKGNQ